MKIKRLIALSAMAAALASGVALAQDNHYDGSWHHPAAWQDQQGPSLQNRNKDSREDQIRKQRERDEKIRKQREKFVVHCTPFLNLLNSKHKFQALSDRQSLIFLIKNHTILLYDNSK